MAEQTVRERSKNPDVTVEDVSRVLEVGRVLLSVLTPDELTQLQTVLLGGLPGGFSTDVIVQKIGNAGVT